MKLLLEIFVVLLFGGAPQGSFCLFFEEVADDYAGHGVHHGFLLIEFLKPNLDSNSV